MLARIANRRNRLRAVALALVLNLGGGPMAWAHLAGARADAAAVPAAQMAADCPQHHAAPGDAKSDTHSMPCCDAGTCTCATPPAPPTLVLAAPADLRHEPPPAISVESAAADPLDDSLRPPIR